MWWLALTAPPALAAPIAEAWVRLDEAAEPAALRALGLGFAEGIASDAGGTWLRVHGSPEALDAAEAAGLVLRQRSGDHRLPPSLIGGYRDPEAMADRLTELAAAYPDRAELVQLGQSLEDRPILGLRLGRGGGASWRILGGHHGDELSGAELALATAEALLSEDPRMPPGLLDRAEVWVVPHVNPDGVARGSRYNARDIDLNRNYGFQWRADEPRSGDGPFSEPETRAIRALSLLEPFLAGLSMHSGAQNIGYVYNYTEADTIEEERLAAIGDRYAAACALEGFYATNGAAWYVTYGDANDWAYGARAALDYTLEVSDDKTPPSGELDGYLRAHLPAVGAFLGEPVRLRGRVISAETGRPVEALITAVGQTEAFPSDPESGGFARLVPEGSITLRIEAPGYTATSLVAGEGEVVEVALEPSGLSAPEVSPKILTLGRDRVEVYLGGLDPLPPSITLWRPGADPLSVSLSGSSYPVPTAELVPGPYSLIWDGGAAARALFAGNPSDRVNVSAVEDRGDSLVLWGQGFAIGARAWGLWGTDRALEPVAVLDWAADALILDAAALPRDRPVDVLVATNGAELAVVDALGTAVLDTGAPGDTGFAEPGGADTGPGAIALRPVGCGCAGTRAPTGGALGLLSLLMILRRRP